MGRTMANAVSRVEERLSDACVNEIKAAEFYIDISGRGRKLESKSTPRTR